MGREEGPKKTGLFLDETDKKQKNHSAEDGHDDGTDKAVGLQAEESEEPPSKHGAQYTHDQIPNEAEAAA